MLVRGMFKIYDEPESPNKGGGVFTVWRPFPKWTVRPNDEPESPNEGAHYVKQPVSRNEGACLRF